MRRKVSVAALIINWNGAPDTIELLQSLGRCQSDAAEVGAIVIDNASVESDVLVLAEAVKSFEGMLHVQLRANSENVGVPAAYNQAIQIAGLHHDHYLRLDNDVVVDPEGFAAMLRTLEEGAGKGVHIVGGNIRYFDTPGKDNGGAVAVDLVRGRTAVDYPDEDVICDGVLGCIMMLSGSLVRRYTPGVFEGSLFICTDETELSLRAARDGMRTMYLARPVGYHKGGRSTGRVPFLSSYYSSRNWTLHRLRYARGGWEKFVVAIRLPLDVARSLVRGRFASVVGVLSGTCLAVAWFTDSWARRAGR